MQLIAAEKLSSGEDVEDYVARKISDADVTVFAKSYCPHCKASRNLLHRLHDDSGRKWTLDIVDLDLLEDHDGPFIQMELLVREYSETRICFPLFSMVVTVTHIFFLFSSYFFIETQWTKNSAEYIPEWKSCRRKLRPSNNVR
jgi:glutaredoxin